jgi:carbon-monoxide dehydrogenase large subunit
MRRNNSLIGSSVERIEDLRFVRGRGKYIADLPAEGCLHAAVLRSPIAHARIRAIDAQSALGLNGVRAVLTAAEIGTVPKVPLRTDIQPGQKLLEQPMIASGKVRYVGEPVAVVIAQDAATAEDALAHIGLDLDPLLPVATQDMSRAPRSLLFEEAQTNCAGKLTGIMGNADAAFHTATYVRRERLRIHRHSAIPMEPRGVLARWDADHARLTVFGAAKAPFRNRRTLAGMLGIPENAISFVENDVGGGFGVRGEFYPEDFLIPFAARWVGLPVRWIEDRREHFLATAHAREAECEIEIACRADGIIQGLRASISCDIGAYLRANGGVAPRNLTQALTGPYRIPNLCVETTMQLTNKTPAGTYRAPGRYESDFFRERIFDMAADDLRIDRAEFRRRNLVPEEAMPYPLAKIVDLGDDTACDSGDYQITLDRCLKEFGWTQKRPLDGKLVGGRYHGIGIGCFIESGGAGPQEDARIALDPDGQIAVYVGSSALGQGLETIFAQIAADSLDCPMSQIRGVFHGSTDYVANGFGSYASRSTVMGGSAIVLAAKRLKDIVRQHAATSLGCTADSVTLDFASQEASGTDGRTVSLSELLPAGLIAEATFACSKKTYSYGAHAAHITVDPMTGRVDLLDYVAVDDVGRAINPALVHGQALGAIVQGLGGTLLEHLVYDDEAQLLTGSFADYLLPLADNFPNIRVVTLELKPSPNNPLGAKGAGEGGIIPVGGVIANAVSAALRSLDVQVDALPLGPAQVWGMIQKRNASA